MITTAEVYLWGTRIGIVHQSDTDHSARFEYDKGFIKSGIEVAPIMMPLSEMVYEFPELGRTDSFRGLPGLLADSLPDKFGNAVINEWLALHGREPDSFTAIERLCYTGKRGMGAIEYVPAVGVDATEESLDVTELAEFASYVLNDKKSKSIQTENINKMSLIEVGSSAGGARAKAVVAWNRESGEIRSGQIDAGKGFEYWIIKLDGVKKNGDHEITDEKQYTSIEYAYYLMAKDMGIDMEECRILEKDGLKHFLTKRFDRTPDGKIHMQSLAAIGHYDYNIPGLCSYEMYFDIARRLGIGKRGMEQLFRRAVFNIASVNCDDHVKNFSFLMDKSGTWNISPAYDVCFAYNPGNRWISEHQMSLNGKRKDISVADLEVCGVHAGLTKPKCKEIIGEANDVISRWMDFAASVGITEKRAAQVYEMIKKNGIA